MLFLLTQHLVETQIPELLYQFQQRMLQMSSWKPLPGIYCPIAGICQNGITPCRDKKFYVPTFSLWRRQ